MEKKRIRVVIAPDSFKGSLTAAEAAAAIDAGVRKAAHEAGLSIETVIIPVADGGEGFADCLSRYMPGQWVTATVTGPLGAPVQARYYMADDGNAIIEMAAAAGLHLVGTPTPETAWSATTHGVGELMADAIDRGASRIIMGLGGSATTDGGSGLLEALEGQKVNVPIIAAVDVDNVMCGPQGAAAVFGPQKGADAKTVAALESRLRKLAARYDSLCGRSISTTPGSGAAGATAAALLTLGAEMHSGIQVILNAAGFERIVADADLVITGEGRLDRQTLGGKAPMGVLRAAGAVPVIAIGGNVDEEAVPTLLAAGFKAVVAATPPRMPLHEALKPETAMANLRRAAGITVPRVRGAGAGR